MKNCAPLREEGERFWLFIAQDATMGDFTDYAVAHESHGFERSGFMERTHHALFIPQGSAAAQDVFHHVENEALILFELARETDELQTLFTGEYCLGLFDQFRPEARRRKTILFEKIFSVVKDSCVNKKRHAEDLTAILIRQNRCWEELGALRGGKITIQRQRPTCRCKLRGPDCIHKKNVQPRVAIF